MYISRVIYKFIKGFLYLFVARIIYKFIHKQIIKKNIKIENVDNSNSYTSYDNSGNELVLYEEPKKIRTKKYDLNEIYNNFFGGIKTDVENDFGFKVKKDEDIKPKNNIMSRKDKSLISELNNDVYLDDNKIVYSFETKKEYIYKIICKIFVKDVKSIKLLISNNTKEFIHKYSENNLLDNENIDEYGFVLDNNNFLDDNIKITIFFENIKNNQININTIKFDVIEKCRDNYNSEINLPIIIFDVNKRYSPIYFNNSNILDIDFNENNLDNNENTLFFI